MPRTFVNWDDAVAYAEKIGRRLPDETEYEFAATAGGKRGEIGEAPSIAADEPDLEPGYPVGGGSVTEEENAPPVADPGPDA